MERKLIKQGGGGLTIYLPKKWIDQKKLREGDSVNVIEKDSFLQILGVGREKSKSEFIIDKSNRADLYALLTHFYRTGTDSIKISNLDKESYGEVKYIVQNLLLGFEITDHTNHSCLIENVSEPSPDKFYILLKRALFLIRETIALIKANSEKGIVHNIEEFSFMRNDLDKNILFCRRTISKGLLDKDPVIFWELLTFIVQIEHTLFYLSEYMIKNKFPGDKRLLDLIEDLQGYFILFEKSYNERDVESIHSINLLKKNYQFGKCISLLEKSKGNATTIISYLKEVFRLIQVGTSPLLSEILKSKYSSQGNGL